MLNLPAKSLLFFVLAIAWMGAISYLSARTEPLVMLPASVQEALGASAWDSRVPVAANLVLFAILGLLFIGAIVFWRPLVRAAVFILVCTLSFAIWLILRRIIGQREPTKKTAQRKSMWIVAS